MDFLTKEEEDERELGILTSEEWFPFLFHEIRGIREKQLFMLQNIGALKADVIRVKELVKQNKWFIDFVINQLTISEVIDLMVVY